MKIGRFDLLRDVLVVAEIGLNHEGSPDRARALVEAAADAGAPAVKFQTYRTEAFVAPDEEAPFRMLRAFELPIEAFADLAGRARRRGMLFLSTPFDLGSVDGLAPFVDAYKIASGDLDFFPLLDRVAATGKPLIVSTGASDLPMIERTVAFLRDRGAGDRLALLHCVSAYPAAGEDANLLAMVRLAERFPNLPVGYSDHVIGLEASVAAASLGARVIEKHFTLDKARSDLPDHRLSADPADLVVLLARVRAAAAAPDPTGASLPAAHRPMLGTGEKRLLECERSVVARARRSISAAADLPAGRVLVPADLTWLRPADGLPPGEEGRLLGRRLKRPVRAGERIREADVE